MRKERPYIEIYLFLVRLASFFHPCFLFLDGGVDVMICAAGEGFAPLGMEGAKKCGNAMSYLCIVIFFVEIVRILRVVWYEHRQSFSLKCTVKITLPPLNETASPLSHLISTATMSLLVLATDK